MAKQSPVPRLTDIIDAIELIRSEMAGVTLEAFESDRRKRWLVERGVEIISEASRHLPVALKARHASIPWPKVAASAMSCAMTTSTLRTMCCGTWCVTTCRDWRKFAGRNWRRSSPTSNAESITFMSARGSLSRANAREGNLTLGKNVC
jgi:hypothetical protein